MIYLKLKNLPGSSLLDEKVLEHLEAILNEGLKAADPTFAVKSAVQRREDVILVKNKTYKSRRVHVVGFGKASYGMLKGLCEILSDLISGGVIIAPRRYGSLCGVRVLEGDHPVPGLNTLKSTIRLLEYLEANVQSEDLVFVLISGGGSALFELPVDGVTIEDIAEVTKHLLKSGADIYEINTVRKHLSKVKGGRLLEFIKGRVISLLISDVVGDDPSTIASGPTTPDPTTFKDALYVLEKYKLFDKLPRSVTDYILRGVRGLEPETKKPNDNIFEKVDNIIVANNYLSLSVMMSKARELGYNTLLLTPYLTGEAREVAKVLAAILRSIIIHGHPVKMPATLIAGGETTVTVKGKGVGGRNQELCLALTIELRDVSGKITTACLASDGVDGNSPSAGAITGNLIYKEATSRGLDPRSYLEENDSYSFFSKLGLAIETGYTGTNVNDFFVAIIADQ